MAFVSEDLKTLLNEYTYSWFTITGNTTGISKWDTITGNVSGATAIVVEIDTLTLMVYILAGDWEEELIVGTGATISVIDNSVPSIRLISGDHPSSHSDDGEVIIKGDNQVGNIGRNNHRDEAHRIEIEINYDGQSDPTMLNRLIRQIQHSFDAENRKAVASRILSTRNYYWSLLFTWSGNTRLGSVEMFVDCDKRWIVI